MSGTREVGKELFERQMKHAGLICESISGRHGAHYVLRDPTLTLAKSITVRLTTSANETFSLYSSTQGVGLLVYIWVQPSGKSKTYALTYDEAYRIMQDKGYTNTFAWNSGGYSVTHSGAELKNKLRVFLMNPQRWQERIRKLSE